MTWTTRQRSDIAGLAAVRTGAGPDLLLLHGVGLRAEAWGAQIPALGHLARITAPDMPGHGESPVSKAELDLSAFAGALLAVLHDLDGPAVVAGHSMGAMIALELAVRAPEKVIGVVALNAVFERSEAAALAVKNRAAALDGLSVSDPGPTLERWFADTPSAAREACNKWLTSVDPAAYKTAYSAFANSTSPAKAALASMQCPALFMTGSQEPNSTPAMSHAMARLAPKGKAIIIEGAAHMMPMTHPDEVNAALLQFLEEVQA